MGNTTALLNDGGAVLERFLYNVDGLPRAIQPDGTLYTFGSDNLDEVTSRYGWVFLAGQMRFEQYLNGVIGSTSGSGGFYDLGNGRFVNPHNGRLITPNLNNIQDGASFYTDGVTPGGLLAATHLTLDVLGFIPGAGVVFDGLNAAIYTTEAIYHYANGDSEAGQAALLNAGISVIAAIPIKGYLAVPAQVARQSVALGKLGARAAAPAVKASLTNPVVRGGLMSGSVLLGM